MAARDIIQNYNNEYIWNPWHGCHRVSKGCDHCSMIEKDYKRGYTACEEVKYNKSQFYIPVRKTKRFSKSLDKNIMEYKIPSGSTIRVCEESDFLIEEADYYRKRAWKIIRERKDCLFAITTKRIERFNQVVPENWFNGWHNVLLGVSVEDQLTADIRIPQLLNSVVKHRCIEISPILGYVDITTYLSTGLIDNVIVRGETSNHSGVRVCDYKQVLDIASQCRLYDVNFIFERTGSKLLKDETIVRIKPNEERNLANFYNIDINNVSFNWEADQKELDNIDRIEKAAEIFKLIHNDKNFK